MKQTWNSFLQTVFQYIKMLSASAPAKRRRDTAVLTAGILLVTAITFAAGSFPETGNGAMVAFAETPGETGVREETASEGIPDEEKDDPESIMTAAEAADMENGEETGKEETDGSGEAAREESESSGDGTAQEAFAAAEDPASREEASAPEAEEAGSQISLSDRDYQTLLRIVQAEAGNCDRIGRILVANVILNRVESDTFPDTVHGVVYQRHQFSPVSNGSINRCRVTDATVEAVDSALAGEDYSDGALYFMNRRASSRKNVRWFDNHLDFLFKHGNHEFFK